MSPLLAQKKDVEVQADLNAKVNKERFEKYNGANNSQCLDPNRAAQARFDSARDFQEALRAQNLAEISRTENQLTQSFNAVNSAEQNAIQGNSGTQVNTQAFEQIQQQHATNAQRVANAQRALENAEADEALKLSQYREVLARCTGGCPVTHPLWQEVTRKELAWREAQDVTFRARNALIAAERALARSAREVDNARALGNSLENANETQTSNDSNEDRLASEAERAGVDYQNYLNLLNRDTELAADLARRNTLKIAELELQLSHSSDYELFNLLLRSDQQNSNIEDNRTNPLLTSNLEILTMAGAAVKDLRCGFGGARDYENYSDLREPIVDQGSSRTHNVRDKGGEDWTCEWTVRTNRLINALGASNNFSVSEPTCQEVKRWTDVDSKAYHMFRAASATYLIGQMNENADFNDKVSCMVDEEFNEGEEKYNDTKNEQVASVERATNLLDEIVSNVCQKVTPDRDLLEPDSYERLVEACGEKGVQQSDVRTRENALIMYQTAYELALKELTQKRELIVKSKEMIAKAEGRVDRLEGKIKQNFILVAVNFTLHLVHRSLCSPLNAISCTLAPVHLGLAVAGSAYWMLKLAPDLGKAANNLEEWLNRREQALVHTHLSCNYDKALSVMDDHRRQAEEIERRVKESVEEARAASSQGILTQLFLPNQNNKFVYDSFLNNRIQKNLMKASSKIEAGQLFIDWNRSLEGAVASRPYDSFSFTTKHEEEILQNKLASFGLQLVKRLKSSSKAIANFILSDAVAQNTSQLDNSQRALGIADGGASFIYFVENKDQQWADQAYHAYKDERDGALKLTKENMRQDIIDVYDLNSSNNNRIVGMSIPETREVHLGSVVQMLTQNLAQLNFHLDRVVNQRDKMVHLLRNMKTTMELGVTGVDEDVPDFVDDSGSGCLSNGLNGNFKTDPNCSCKASNTCLEFSYPKFGDIGALGVARTGFSSKDINSRLALRAANSTIQGQVGSNNIDAAKLARNANQIRDRIAIEQSKLNENRRSRNLDPVNFQSESQRNLERLRSNNRRTASANNSPLTDVFTNNNGLPGLQFTAADRNRLLGNNVKGQNSDAQSSTSQALAAVSNGPNSSRSRSGNNFTGQSQNGADGLSGEAPLLDLSLDDEDSSLSGDSQNVSLTDEELGNSQSAADIDFSLDGDNGPITDQDLSNLSPEERARLAAEQNGSLGRNYYGSNANRPQVESNRQTSLFTIITKRYRQTAFPVLLRKRKL